MEVIHQVRIPGKVMLSGEYAVLHGAWAVLMPVERFLTVSEVEASGDELVSPVILEALRESVPELAGLETENPLVNLHFDRSEFYAKNTAGESTKLGLGSSAAEAVGVIALRYERAGIDWRKKRREVAEHADSAHRRAQGGAGSGADVFVCAYGMPVRFRRFEGVVEVEPVSISRNTPLHLLWTGIAADTRQFVALFEKWREVDEESGQFVAQLIDAANDLSERWDARDSEALLAGLNSFVETMGEISDRAGMVWKPVVFEEVLAWTKQNGGLAKPTGAGGGDLLLAIGDLPLQERTECVLNVCYGIDDERFA